ncbi:hypothetical protein JZ751_025173 [Albula glossodonta]|uniref:Uncharacterized protein n=1 Tax=Albula glossodonta TaxID=121402 RepID=A0A8T2PJF3_9TELE|nr:hypothetical protein JZ751_025173 [Albula glossodonta]
MWAGVMSSSLSGPESAFFPLPRFSRFFFFSFFFFSARSFCRRSSSSFRYWSDMGIPEREKKRRVMTRAVNTALGFSSSDSLSDGGSLIQASRSSLRMKHNAETSASEPQHPTHPLLHLQVGTLHKEWQSLDQQLGGLLSCLAVLRPLLAAQDGGKELGGILHIDRLDVPWEGGHLGPQHGFQGLHGVLQVGVVQQRGHLGHGEPTDGLHTDGYVQHLGGNEVPMTCALQPDVNDLGEQLITFTDDIHCCRLHPWRMRAGSGSSSFSLSRGKAGRNDSGYFRNTLYIISTAFFRMYGFVWDI